MSMRIPVDKRSTTRPTIGWNIPVILILVFIFVLSSFNAILFDEPPQQNLMAPLKPSIPETGIPIQGSRGGEIWTLSEEINYSMEINKGGDNFIKISPRAPAGR